MSLTVSAERPVTDGHRRKVYADVTFDSSYPTGGEPVTAGDFGLQEIEELSPMGTTTNGYLVAYDRVNKKLKARRTDQVDDPAEEVPDTTALNAESVRVLAIGW